jgi:hypothetical protein
MITHRFDAALSTANGSGALLPVQQWKGEIYLFSSSPNGFEGYVVMRG